MNDHAENESGMIEQLREAVETKTGKSSVEIPRDDLRQLLAIAAERDALRESNDALKTHRATIQGVVDRAEKAEVERDGLRKENERIKKAFALAEPNLHIRADFYRQAEHPE